MTLEENMSRNVYAHTYNLESVYLKLIKISIIINHAKLEL